jgi:hypothetical protein
MRIARLIKWTLLAVLILALAAAIPSLTRGFSSAPGGHPIRAVRAWVAAGDDSAAVRLRVDIAGPGSYKELRLPYFPEGVSLTDARIDGRPADLDLVDGRPAIVLKGGGEHAVELAYTMPLAGDRSLTLSLPPGIVNTIELTLPQSGLAVRAAPPAIVEALPSEEGTLVRNISPPMDQVAISWLPRPAEVTVSARVALRTETLYTIQGDALAARTVCSLRAEGRDVIRHVFALGPGVSVDQVEGAWVKNWEATGGKLTVQAAAPLAGEHALVIHHRRPLNDKETDLAPPALEGAVRQWGFGAVAAGGAVEIKDLAIERGTLLDPRGLPETLREAGAAQVARAFRYDAMPSKQRLTVVRHSEIETLEATCDSLNALLVCTPDGRCVGKAVYMVRNARRQHIEVGLPPGAKIWSVFVAGNPVRPALGENGRMLVPLSCSPATAQKGFAVELVYFLESKPFADKGRFEAALPDVDLPVMQTMLSVSVPDEIQLEDFAGGLRSVDAFAFVLEARDVALIQSAERANPTDQDVQDANRQVREQMKSSSRGQVNVRVPYEAVVRNGGFQQALRYNNGNNAFVAQYYLENSTRPEAPAAGRDNRLNLTGFGQEELAGITGLASLSVAVPTGGRIYRFERELLIGSKNGAAAVSADYWSALAARPKADGSARLSSSSAALFRLAPRAVLVTAALRYTLDAGKVDLLTYRLPQGLKVNSLQGANVAEWKAADGSVEVKLVRPERRGGQLLLRGELPAAEEIDASFAAPRLSGAAAEESLVGVTAPQDYQATFPEADRLERLSPRGLPAELIAESRDSAVVFRLSGADSALRVKAGRRKGVDALTATCDSVNAISCLTEEGVGVTRAIYEIRNVAQRHLEVTLPAGAKLWSAFVADRAVKPLEGKDGRLLIPLDVSPDGQVRACSVEVIYLASGSPFERRGNFAVDLPAVDVPVMYAMYSMYLPKKLRLDDFAGALKPVKEFTAPAAPVAITADVARIRNKWDYYNDRQSSLENNVTQRDAAIRPGLPAGVPDAAAPAESGLKLYIPAVGQLLRFERHLILEGSMNVSCTYRG